MKINKLTIAIMALVLVLIMLIIGHKYTPPLSSFSPGMSSLPPSPVESIPPDRRQTPDLIVLGARQEALQSVQYDGSYRNMTYPGGDVPSDRGACTDVVIRAFRNAGLDLQVLIHEDMAIHFSAYPQNWGLEEPDTSIDHRRIPNQVTFFKRHGTELPTRVKENLDDWQWGDVVYWQFPNGDEHCGIVSDRRRKDGIPLVIHNAGICKEEDCLQRWTITGHYRYP